LDRIFDSYTLSQALIIIPRHFNTSAKRLYETE
jgi:hypothetical protein